MSNVVTGVSVEKKEAVADTGFDCSIMADSETYGSLHLGLSEKPEAQFPAYTTMTGTIIFRGSLCRAKVAGKDILAEVISPVQGRGKCLLGRELLKQFTTLLQRAETCRLGDADVKR